MKNGMIFVTKKILNEIIKNEKFKNHQKIIILRLNFFYLLKKVKQKSKILKLFGNHVKASRNRDALTRFSAAHSSFRTGLLN